MTRERPPTFSSDPDHDLLDNVSHLKPQPAKRDLPMEEARLLAEEQGFSAREAVSNGFVDARSLRKTNRTAQLNISVTVGTKNRFWQYAQKHGYTAGEEALLALLNSQK